MESSLDGNLRRVSLVLGQAQILGLKEPASSLGPWRLVLTLRQAGDPEAMEAGLVLGRYGSGAVGASLALGWVRSLGT